MSSSPALQCATCQTLLASDALSCPACGDTPAVRCRGCGFVNRARARFCGACGRALRLAGAGEAVRAEDLLFGPALQPRHSAPPDLRAAPQPASAVPFALVAASIVLAVLGQSALLRTHAPLPAVPLFVVAAVLGGWVALRGVALPRPPLWQQFPIAGGARRWKAPLGLAVAANVASLVLFGRGTAPTLGWLLFASSVLLAGYAFWTLDGRPGLRADWRAEAPWLIALGVLVAAGSALRLIAIDSIPFGLWFDEAYSGLQVQRILADPAFRPVYVGGLAQEPSLLWYLMVPAFKLFGPGLLALRLPAALGGILGIPAIYLLGRELFGRKTGLIAAALLTTLVWHLTFSRVAFNSEWSVTLDALGLFSVVRALKKGSWTAAALAGLSLGLGLHMYYTSRLMILLAAAALVAFWLQRPRANGRNAMRVALAAAAAGLIGGSPIAEFALQHPAEFNSRLQQASVLNDVRQQHSYGPLLESAKAHLLMFNVAGDRNARHNLPGQPELNFLLGGLFVLGLGLALARARRPEYLLLPLWAVIMLAGGVLSVAFEAPQSLRTIDEVNVVVLLCALPLALLWEAASGLRVGPSPAAAGEGRVRVPAPTTLTLALSRQRERGLSIFGLTPRPVLALLPVWTAAAVWLTDPLYRHLTTAIPAGFDASQMLWDLWWTKYALVNLHQSPLYTDYVFAPQHINLAFHSLMPLSGLLSIPVQLTLGLFAAFNFILLGSLVASCAGAYLLVRQETGSRAGAFVGSLVFGFAPYKLAHLGAGHLPAVTTWAVPFFVLLLLRWLRLGRARDAALAGLFLACAGLTDLNLFALSLLLGCALAAGIFWTRRTRWPRVSDAQSVLTLPSLAAAVKGCSETLVRRLRGLGALGLVSGVLMLPSVAALLDGLAHGWPTGVPLRAATGWSPDLLGYVLPLPDQPWWGSLGREVAGRFHFLDAARVVFVGYTALALAIVALWRRRSNAREWWLIVVAFWLLSLGPVLHVAGATELQAGPLAFSLPLPFRILREVPFVGGIANPGYFSLLFMLGLAVLAGHGLARVASGRRRPAAMAGLVGLAVMAESLTTPLRLYSPRPEPVFARLAAEPGREAALVAPVGWIAELGGDGSLDMSDLYYATVAAKPVVSGYVSRLPVSYLDFYRNQPALSMLLFPDRPPTPQSQDPVLVRDALHRIDVGYLVLRRWPNYDRQLAYVTQVLRLPKFYDDGQATAFRVPA